MSRSYGRLTDEDDELDQAIKEETKDTKVRYFTLFSAFSQPSPLLLQGISLTDEEYAKQMQEELNTTPSVRYIYRESLFQNPLSLTPQMQFTSTIHIHKQPSICKLTCYSKSDTYYHPKPSITYAGMLPHFLFSSSFSCCMSFLHFFF